ncbi:MAG TPA: glycosyl hydrolase 108 family protein [Dissulfurispiraceae bacterium]|nr:glycosyl hydrolase 108 family protein [Dissulfurispiraceae bacterium]
MPQRPPKIDKSGVKPFDLIENLRSSQKNLSNSSFNKIFSASFKQMEDMQAVFKKDLFKSSAPVHAAHAVPVQTSPASSGVSDIIKIVMNHEGTAYVRKDGGRESSKMGILQSTAREYGYTGDIRNISKAQAEAIYKKMWDKSDAAKLPYPLSVVHFDTYVNSPSAAVKILRKSGGDVDSYLKMREERFSRLAAARPDRYGKYLNGWMNRIESLRSVVAQCSNMSDMEKTRISSAPNQKTSV